MTEEVKRCLCGNRGIAAEVCDTKKKVVCCDYTRGVKPCAWQTAEFDTYEEAIAAWNHRPLEDAKDARIAELEDEVMEQARLLGMGGEREADLLGKVERLERQLAWREGVQETHSEDCWKWHKECAMAKIAELERQLADATQWRSPETAPRDGTWFRARFDDDCEVPARFADDFDGDFCWRDITNTARKRVALAGWRECACPLPEPKKEEA